MFSITQPNLSEIEVPKSSIERLITSGKFAHHPWISFRWESVDNTELQGFANEVAVFVGAKSHYLSSFHLAVQTGRDGLLGLRMAVYPAIDEHCKHNLEMKIRSAGFNCFIWWHHQPPDASCPWQDATEITIFRYITPEAFDYLEGLDNLWYKNRRNYEQKT